MLHVNDLVVRMPGFELKADALELAPGQVASLTGPSGSGKTTFLRALAGLERLERGRIQLQAEELNGLPPAKRQIGVVFQEGDLFPALTVGENAAFGLRARGVSASEARTRVLAALQEVGLGGMAERRVGGLSGGERSRVAWVRATIWNPKLLLLDEPFAALDERSAQALATDLLRILERSRAPTVLVSHGPLPAPLRAHVQWRVEGEGAHRKIGTRP